MKNTEKNPLNETEGRNPQKRINRIRICVVSLKYPPEYSGAGLQAQRLFQKMKQKGGQYFVITASGSGYQKNSKDDGEDIVKIKGTPGSWTSLSLLLFWWKLFVLLFQKRRDYDFVYIVSANLPLSILGLYSRVLGKKSIVKLTLAKSDIADVGNGFWGKLQGFFLNFIDRYVAISDEIYSELCNCGFPKEKILLLPNGVDCSVFSPRKKNIDNNSVPKLLFVGILDKRKGVDILLEAWLDLKKQKNPQVQGELVMVGPYDKSSSVLSTFDMNELKKNSVCFLGERSDINLIMKECDIFVLPSSNEGLPNVALEAMASGLPIIISNSSGGADCVTHNTNGLIFEMKNKTQLMNFIKKLLCDGSMRRKMGYESRVRALKSFSIDQVVDRYFEILSELK